MNYTYNNHLYYTIGGRKFGHRLTPYEQYKVYAGKVDPVVYKNSSWRNELVKTADSVYKEYGKDLILFLSGGTDSEIVLRNFLEIGVKPKCVIIKFVNDYNLPDVLEGIEIAKQLDVKLDIIDFDVKEFYKSGQALDFSKQIDCTQITYLMVYYHIMKFSAPAVMGGEMLLSRHVSQAGTFWYHCFRENEDASAMRFSEKFNIPIVNEWFSYTPEMMLYYLENPDVQKLITDRFNYKLTSVSSKNAILSKLYPEIKLRKKTTGFERLMGFNSDTYRKLRTHQVTRLTPCLNGIPIKSLLSNLKGE
jgi:hypothetical protein